MPSRINRVAATVLLLLALAIGGRSPAYGQTVTHKRAPIIIAIPANRSPKLEKQLRIDIARLYAEAQPGDRYVFVNASDQGVVKDIIVPQDLGETDRDRDDALLDLFAPVNRFLAADDSNAPIDNLNIPSTLRAIGLNVLPRFEGSSANVILVGSMMWENRRDATWSFKTHIVLDGFLNMSGGPFGVVGEENILKGALVSILYTDDPSAFRTTSVQNYDSEFWGKSIKGRGGRVGAIEEYANDAYPRLFATTEDPTPYAIDPKAPRAIGDINGTSWTPVVRLGQPQAAPSPPSPNNRPTSSASKPVPGKRSAQSASVGGATRGP